MRKILYLSIFIFSLHGCVLEEDSPVATETNRVIGSGDVLVASSSGYDLVGIDYVTGLSTQITSLDRTTDTARGIGYMETSGNILTAVDGRDRIVTINPYTGELNEYITSGQYSGLLRSVIQLSNGDILAIESNNLERFTIQGLRITTGWPLSINTPYQLKTLTNGGFLVCAGGTTDEVRVYDDDGNLQYSDAGPGGHDAIGCAELDDGRISVTWSGASSAIWIYNSDLTSGTSIFTNTDVPVMPNPQMMAASRDGNILFVDGTYQHIVEITPAGDFVRTFGVVVGPVDLFVVP